MRFSPGKALLDLLFPPRCVFCASLLKDGEEGFCADCQRELPWLTEGDCEQKGEFFSLCVSPLRYEGVVRRSVHRFKFSDRSGYAEVYGHLLARCVQEHLAGRYDLITWVPLSEKSLKQRGYDQAKLLAEHTAAQLGFRAQAALRKVGQNRTQSSLKEPAARRANVLGMYEIIDPKAVAGKRIVLIDDVVTTGATLSECSRVLRTYGAAEVVCAAVARAGK